MKRNRRASVMLEATVAMLLVALAMAAVAQLLIVASRQQRATQLRTTASREAANVMERLLARPLAQLPLGMMDQEKLSDEVGSQLLQAKLAVEIQAVPDEPDARRIDVEVSWQNIAGEREQIDLVAWKFAEGG